MGWDGAGLGSKNQSGQGKVLINSLPEHPGEEKFQITPHLSIAPPQTSPPTDPYSPLFEAVPPHNELGYLKE